MFMMNNLLNSEQTISRCQAKAYPIVVRADISEHDRVNPNKKQTPGRST